MKMGRFLKKVGKKGSKSDKSDTGPSHEGASSEETRTRRSARSSGGDRVRILKKGPAMRVIFFYPGEEGTYVDNAEVTLYENGIIHIQSNQEETTTHLQNCEILWRFEVDADDRANKLRLLKPKTEARGSDEPSPSGKKETTESTDHGDGKPTKGSSKNPELR